MMGMGSMPLEQSVTVGQALLVGVIMGIYYDLFRIIRRIIPCGYASIVAQDVFFWVTSAIGVFFACIWCTGGTLRIIFVLAVLLGWGAYAATVGAVLIRTVELVMRGIGLVLHRIENKILIPVLVRLKKFAKMSEISAKMKNKA